MINLLAGATVVVSGLTLVGLGVLALRGHQIGIRRDDDLVEALRTGVPNWDLATEPLQKQLMAWRDEVVQP